MFFQVPKSELPFSHPGFAGTVAEEVARIRGINPTEVLTKTRINAKTLFGV